LDRRLLANAAFGLFSYDVHNTPAVLFIRLHQAK
jgi:hypothetical protein